jgi:hypothetical protein
MAGNVSAGTEDKYIFHFYLITLLSFQVLTINHFCTTFRIPITLRLDL